MHLSDVETSSTLNTCNGYLQNLRDFKYTPSFLGLQRFPFVEHSITSGLRIVEVLQSNCKQVSRTQDNAPLSSAAQKIVARLQKLDDSIGDQQNTHNIFKFQLLCTRQRSFPGAHFLQKNFSGDMEIKSFLNMTFPIIFSA